MPGFNGTGPMGKGAMTGGGRGFCSLPLDSQTGGPWAGRRFFNGGCGRGRKNRFYGAGLSEWKSDERMVLQEQIAVIQARLKELEEEQG